MFNSYQSTTLEFKQELCNGCGMCINVCPHAVFELNHRTVRVVHGEACMECGACQLNCPMNAIRVESGVGCAAAMMRAALTRQTEVVCEG